ncbi:MAG: hypothetical protein DYG98_04400 [Haliscomenobacteraceae bacterium CHB4]|nr:hypothetical protein [Saprospiraceae bacterium]MCE7922273.1 hypothetical protein [Haliscomenobacteraceae bacterium CHB4]
MAKTPSDKLYRLIRALSPTEKRYFRLYMGQKSEGEGKYQYQQLFEAIAEMEVFDEEALKYKIYKNQPPEGKKYSELKAYLYEMVLKCLQSFDEQQSLDYRLNHLLQSVAVLYKRGHYDDCRDLLHKAAKLARHYESFTHLLEVIRWEKQLAYTRMDVDFLHKQLEQLQFEEERALRQLRNAADYRRAFFQVYTTIKREAQQRGYDRMTQLQSIVNQDLFGDPDRAESHKARVTYYRTLNLYHYAALEYDQFYETGKKLIALLESQPHFLRENLSDYIAALSNLILSCGMLQRYDEVRICLEKLRTLTPITEDDRRKIHRQYFTNKFALCTYTGEFEEAKEEMERCLRESSGFDSHDYETASFYFQFCTICLGCGDFGRALEYLNEWQNQPRSVEREDLQSLARILALILHFEMGNTVLLDSLLRSATRFLQKKNRLYDLERRFIHFMSELIKQPGWREQQVVFQKMKTDLLELALLPAAKTVLQTFDLAAWLEARIKSQTFAAAVAEKWRKETGKTEKTVSQH